MDYGKAIMAALYFYAACAFVIGGIVAIALFFIIRWLWNHLAVATV